MAKKVYEETNIAAIAEAIRAKTGGDKKYTTAQMPEGVNEVYEAGRKAQYDEFWDSYQNKGDIYSAQYMYAQSGWNDNTFKPKYSQKYMNNASNMFNSSSITDLKGILESRGLTFDFKNCVGFSYFVAYSNLTRLPLISTKKAANLNNFAYGAKQLVEVEIALKDDGSQTFTSAFTNCFELVDFIIRSGVIGQAISFQWSNKLSHESLMSIINALKDFSGTSTWKDITLGSDNLAKLTQEELDIMESKQWNYS